EAAGGRIDFFRIGDDFGTQNSLVMSPRMFRDIIKPALKAMADTAKKYGAYYYHHSCGAVRELIPDLIETGVDVLDPIQVQAAGMVPTELKAEFGQKICFSGGVDEQRLLPNGSPEDVRKGVFQLLEDMARGGGFFIGPTHNFQADIPTANILAMYDAARQWVA
ncbi:MAG: uroporphyrinogen-III decarboxylase, partial [Planctomycetota bacterium]|nr:uroporphyrinogen-III decarboxylase [Planctomycetota bacterium]